MYYKEFLKKQQRVIFQVALLFKMVHPKCLLTVILFMVINNAKESNSIPSTKVFSNEMKSTNKNSKITTKSINFQSYETSLTRKNTRRILTQDKLHTNPQKPSKSSGRSINAPAEINYNESMIVKGIGVEMIVYLNVIVGVNITHEILN